MMIFDIAIVGAGIPGLTLALILRRETGCRIALIDPQHDSGRERLRTIALSAHARLLFQRAGVWQALSPQTQPILDMAIFDAAVGAPVHIESLRFRGTQETPLAHMAYVYDIKEALQQAAHEAGVAFIPAALSGLSHRPFTAALTLDSGQECHARLVVAADGISSLLRRLANIPVLKQPAYQAAVVTTLEHENEHDSCAEQYFLPHGPLAFLPLCGRQSSIVWTESLQDSQSWVDASEAEFVDALQQRCSGRLGALRVVGARQAFPLSFQFAQRFVAERLALMGDAAHVVHPLAGQGLNLGLRDVEALANVAISRLRLGLDPGEPGVLQEYQRRRRLDCLSSGLGMEGLNRLFSNDVPSLRALRNFGLRVVNRSPFLKHRLVAVAAGHQSSR